MYNLPLRRTILQSTLRFFMDALTFIAYSLNVKINNSKTAAFHGKAPLGPDSYRDGVIYTYK